MSQWDWETELCDNPYGGNRYRIFGVYSKFGVLNESVFISLSGNPTGNNLYIGVFTNDALFYKSMNHLKSRLDNEFGPGKSEASWWFWYQSLVHRGRSYYAYRLRGLPV